MAGLIAILFLFTMQCVILDCTKRTFRWKYKPYGFQMCRELCQDWTDAFYYILEDVSCQRVSTNNSTAVVNVTPKDHLMKDRRTNVATNCTVQTGLDVCKKEKGDRRLTLQMHPRLNSILESNLSECDTNPSETQPDLTSESPPTADVELVQYKCGIKLQQACYKGKLDVVKHLLSARLEDINCRGKGGKTPVMLAVGRGHFRVFDYLVRQGCDLSAMDHQNNTVLHLSCVTGNADVVRKLIADKRCGMESRGELGRRPIMWAAYFGRREVFDLFVSRGCDLKALDYNGNNILHVACLGGRIGMIKHMMSMQAVKKMRHWKNKSGVTPVQLEKKKGHLKVVRILDGRFSQNRPEAY